MWEVEDSSDRRRVEERCGGKREDKEKGGG